MSENEEKKEQINCEKKENVKTSQAKKEEKSKATKVNTLETKKAKEKKIGMITRTIAIAIILVIIIALIYIALPSPARVCQQMFRELKAGDFDQINEYVDYEQLINLPILSNESKSEEIKQLLFEDLQFKVKKVEQNEDKATIVAEVTNKNFKTILQNYTQKIMQNIFNNENNSAENIENIFIEELKNKDIDKATSTQNITMEKKDGKWKVVVDENLRNAMFPNLEEALNAITGGIELLQN